MPSSLLNFPRETAAVEPAKNISDQLFLFLKNDILTCKIVGGQRLIESSIASEHNISRTPVREAFRRLEQGGLVYRIPQGGVCVTEVKPEDINEVYRVRAVLEGLAGELACDKITPDILDNLKELNDTAFDLFSKKNSDSRKMVLKVWHINTLFHETIYQATGSEHLVGFLDQIKDIIMRLQFLTLTKTRNFFWIEHQKIIEYLETKDKKNLSEILKNHILRASERVIDSLD